MKIDILNAMPGLNVAAGMECMAGNEALYHKILVRFIHEQADAVSLVGHYLGAADYEAAHLHAHSLKGLSGTIGAQDLHEKAADLDGLINTGEYESAFGALPELDHMLQDLVSGLSKVVLLPDEGVPCASDTSLDRFNPKELLEELRELLEFGDPAASDAVKPLVNLPSFPFKEEVQQISDLISDYMFDEALELVNTLMERL